MADFLGLKGSFCLENEPHLRNFDLLKASNSADIMAPSDPLPQGHLWTV